jgi:hypothetical protein
VSTTAVAVTFAVLGGICELAGLAFVVVGIARDRRRARQLLARPGPPGPPARTYPAPAIATRATPEYASPAFSSSHHIRGVIEHMQRSEAAIANAFLAQRKSIDAALDEVIVTLRQEMTASDAEVRDAVRYVLAGSVRDRSVGVALLAVGIIFAVTGSVTGALA